MSTGMMKVFLESPCFETDMLATVVASGKVPVGPVRGAEVEECPLDVALCAAACCAVAKGSKVVEPNA